MAAVVINSGFRSVSHNASVGRASTVTQVMNVAKTAGFSGIIRYSSHTHVDSGVEYPYGAQSWYWTA